MLTLNHAYIGTVSFLILFQQNPRVMILFDKRITTSDKLVSLQLFKQLQLVSCKPETNSQNYAGFSFDVKEFNDIIRSNCTYGRRNEVSTQTSEGDFRESARAWSPSMINRKQL